MKEVERKAYRYLSVAKDLPIRIYTCAEFGALVRLSKVTIHLKYEGKVVFPLVDRSGRKYYTDSDVIKLLKYRFPFMTGKRGAELNKMLCEHRSMVREKIRLLIKKAEKETKSDKEVSDAEEGSDRQVSMDGEDSV